jgi:hypothetical protein
MRCLPLKRGPQKTWLENTPDFMDCAISDATLLTVSRTESSRTSSDAAMLPVSRARSPAAAAPSSVSSPPASRVRFPFGTAFFFFAISIGLPFILLLATPHQSCSNKWKR